MITRRKILAGMASLPVAATLTGCNGTSTTVAMNDIITNAQAADKLVENIIGASGFMATLSASAQASVTTIETNISKAIASMQADAGKTITIVTGKQWATAIVSELEQLINIAEPIAEQYNTQVATYLSLTSMLISVIDSIVGTATSASIRVGQAPIDAAQVRAAIYRGIGA